MNRVEIPSPPDLVQDALGNVLAGRSVTLKLAGTATDATHYSALTGGTSTTGGTLLTYSDGTIRDASGTRRYVDSGMPLDLAIAGVTRRIEPMSALAAGAIASTFLTPSGSDDSAAMVSALTSYAPFAFPTVILGPGTFLWNTSVPALARSLPCKIMGAGIGRTIVKLSTGAPRFLDFNKIADYDTFNDIEVTDLTIDADNIGGSHHVILGTQQAGVIQSKMNINRVALRRIRTINVITDTTGAISARNNIYIIVRVNVADTACTMTDIVLEDLSLNGGGIGVSIGGTTNDSSGNGNLFHDRIELTRVNHDTGTVWGGTTYASENIQIGSKDTGGTVTIRDCHGFNSGDVGIAVLNGRYSQVEGCTVTDSRNAMFQAGNFNPNMPIDQTHIFRSCHAKIVALNPSATTHPSTGFLAGGSPDKQLGNVILDNCTFHTVATNCPPPGAAIDVSIPLKALTIMGDMHMDAAQINHTLAANYVGGLIRFRPTGKATFTVRGTLRSNVAGTITRSGFTFQFFETWIDAQPSADYTLDVEDHLPKISLAGVVAGSCYGSFFGPTAVPSTTTVTGTTANTTGNVTALSAVDIAKIAPGDPVTGTGIPANQTVQSVNTAAGSFVFAPSVASASASVTITVTPLACLRGRWRFDWQGDNSGDTAPIGAAVQKWGVPGRAPVSGAFIALGGRLSFDNSNASRMPVGSAGNGNVLGTEIFDVGNAVNAMPLVTYQGIRPANALQKASVATFALANGATTIVNNLGRRYQVWLSVAATAITFARGTDVTATAAFATSGPFYLEPGDQLVVTSAGGSWYRIPADM